METIKRCSVKVIQNNTQVLLEYVFVSSEITFDSLVAKISDGKNSTTDTCINLVLRKTLKAIRIFVAYVMKFVIML